MADLPFPDSAEDRAERWAATMTGHGTDDVVVAHADSTATVGDAVVVEISVLKVKSRGSSANYADGMLYKAQFPGVAPVLEPRKSVFTATANDDIEITVSVEIFRLRVLWDTETTQHSFFPCGVSKRVPFHRKN